MNVLNKIDDYRIDLAYAVAGQASGKTLSNCLSKKSNFKSYLLANEVNIIADDSSANFVQKIISSMKAFEVMKNIYTNIQVPIILTNCDLVNAAYLPPSPSEKSNPFKEDFPNGIIIVSYSRDTDSSVIVAGRLLHELTHYFCEYLFKNDSKPYTKTNNTKYIEVIKDSLSMILDHYSVFNKEQKKEYIENISSYLSDKKIKVDQKIDVLNFAIKLSPLVLLTVWDQEKDPIIKNKIFHQISLQIFHKEQEEESVVKKTLHKYQKHFFKNEQYDESFIVQRISSMVGRDDAYEAEFIAYMLQISHHADAYNQNFKFTDEVVNYFQSEVVNNLGSNDDTDL